MPLNLRPLPRDYQPLGLAIEPKSAADKDKLIGTLHQLAIQDPRLQPSIDPDNGQAWLHASSEGHIESVIEALRNAGVAANVGVPQIAYREMLSAPVESDYTHKKNLDPESQFARVKLCFEPSQRSMSNTFVNSASVGAVPGEFVPAIEKGFRAVASSGLAFGFPVVACRATLLDGAYHDVDSSPLAFEIAARAAFRQSVPQAAIKLLEPYLEIDITTPDAFSAAVIADFKSRRGVNTAKEASPGVVAIYGFAPLANMIGYEAHLNAITLNSATYSWKLAGLEEVPLVDGKPPFAPAIAKRS